MRSGGQIRKGREVRSGHSLTLIDRRRENSLTTSTSMTEELNTWGKPEEEEEEEEMSVVRRLH